MTCQHLKGSLETAIAALTRSALPGSSLSVCWRTALAADDQLPLLVNLDLRPHRQRHSVRRFATVGSVRTNSDSKPIQEVPHLKQHIHLA
jgi:hypothetical protein